MVLDGESLYMGNISSTKVFRKGQVELVFTSINVTILRDVYHAPEVNKNLISRPSLNLLGYKLVFESDRCIVSKCGMFVSRCYQVCYIFKLFLKHWCVCGTTDYGMLIMLKCFIYLNKRLLILLI